MHILIIDDNYQTIDRLKEKIYNVNNNHDVTIACSNNEISVALKECPELIFIRSGIGFIEDFFLSRMIRNMDEFKHIPIVMISPWSQNDYYHEAREAGISGFINSSLENATVSAKLENLHQTMAIAN